MRAIFDTRYLLGDTAKGIRQAAYEANQRWHARRNPKWKHHWMLARHGSIMWVSCRFTKGCYHSIIYFWMKNIGRESSYPWVAQLVKPNFQQNPTVELFVCLPIRKEGLFRAEGTRFVDFGIEIKPQLNLFKKLRTIGCDRMHMYMNHGPSILGLPIDRSQKWAVFFSTSLLFSSTLGVPSCSVSFSTAFVSCCASHVYFHLFRWWGDMKWDDM